MRAAVVDQTSNIVTNIIVADASVDRAPDGFVLVNLPDDSPVGGGWVFDPNTASFSDPSDTGG